MAPLPLRDMVEKVDTETPREPRAPELDVDVKPNQRPLIFASGVVYDPCKFLPRVQANYMLL